MLKSTSFFFSELFLFLRLILYNIHKIQYAIERKILLNNNGNISKEERLFAAAIYILSLFSAFIGPLIIWILKKDESNFIDFHGKEYFNFLISISIYIIVSGLLTIILIGYLGIVAVTVYTFVFTIIAAIKSYDGEHYKIPFTIRILN